MLDGFNVAAAAISIHILIILLMNLHLSGQMPPKSGIKKHL
jgi:hypothetical protein